MIYVHQEYKVKIKMVQEQQLQLKIKFLLGYNMEIFPGGGQSNFLAGRGPFPHPHH